MQTDDDKAEDVVAVPDGLAAMDTTGGSDTLQTATATAVSSGNQPAPASSASGPSHAAAAAAAVPQDWVECDRRGTGGTLLLGTEPGRKARPAQFYGDNGDGTICVMFAGGQRGATPAVHTVDLQHATLKQK